MPPAVLVVTTSGAANNEQVGIIATLWLSMQCHCRCRLWYVYMAVLFNNYNRGLITPRWASRQTYRNGQKLGRNGNQVSTFNWDVLTEAAIVNFLVRDFLSKYDNIIYILTIMFIFRCVGIWQIWPWYSISKWCFKLSEKRVVTNMANWCFLHRSDPCSVSLMCDT